MKKDKTTIFEVMIMFALSILAGIGSAITFGGILLRSDIELKFKCIAMIAIALIIALIRAQYKELKQERQ